MQVPGRLLFATQKTLFEKELAFLLNNKLLIACTVRKLEGLPLDNRAILPYVKLSSSLDS